MLRQPYNVTTNQPHIALVVSGVTASASAVNWATDHAVWFTIAAGSTAILSGVAAFIFYIVSTYYKIKTGGRSGE